METIKRLFKKTLVPTVAFVALGACRPPLTLTTIGPSSVSGDGMVTQLFRINRDHEPVPGLEREHFTLTEEGRAVSASEADARIDLRPQSFGLYTVLLLDVSGSLRDHFPELREAARNFVGRMLESGTPGTRQIAVFVFAGDTQVHPLLTAPGTDAFGQPAVRPRASSDRAELSAAIDGIDCPTTGTPRQYCSDRSTNLNGAVVNGLNAMRDLQAEGRRSGVRNTAGALVVFTDGTDRARRVSMRDVDAELARIDEHQYVFSIGLGGEIDPPTLRHIGHDGYVLAEDFPALSGAFGRAADSIANVANSYYLFRYCTPSRIAGVVHVNVAARDRQGSTGSLDLSYTPGPNVARCRIADEGSTTPPSSGGEGSSTAPAQPSGSTTTP